MTRAHPLLLLPLAGTAACQHAVGPAASASPSVRLVQRLVERENGISLHNGYAIEQANVLGPSGETRYKVSNVRCAEIPASRYDCRFRLRRSLGTDQSTGEERRIVWRRRQGDWTTNVIEELCAQQMQALGTTDCVGIVDR